MFDIGCSQADPQTDFLTLSMMDSITHKVVKKEFLSKKGNAPRQVSDIEMHRQQMSAVHTNLQVSSTDIRFEDPVRAGKGDGCDCHLTIDGRNIFEGAPVELEQIAVSRLMLSDDVTQASVPIMTFLPLKDGEL